MKHAAILALMAIVSQSGPAHAADGPRILAPSSDWTLDFADERCSLIREFGEGDDTIRLQIDSFGPRPGYRVLISGGLVPGSDAAPMTEFGVSYSPDTGQRDRMTMFVGNLNGQNAVSFGRGFVPEPAFASQHADEAASAFERSVTHMTVAFKLRKPVQLDTGSMAAPFAAMHRCVDDLIASWGIDLAQHRTRSRAPQVAVTTESGERAFRTNGQDFALVERSGEAVTERNYPRPADRRAQQFARNAYSSGDLVPVRVMIDAAGQPTACVVQLAQVSEAFRQNACESLKGPYQPALDAEGRPMASFIQFDLR